MYEKVDPSARILMLISEILGGIILSAVLFIVWYFAFRGHAGSMVRILMPAVLIVIWIKAFAAPFVRYARLRYSFSEDEIRIREGFINVTETIIPIERLQQISMSSGPFDRMFGLTAVNVTTAGGETTIRFLEKERARKITEDLKLKINKTVKEKRAEEIRPSSGNDIHIEDNSSKETTAADKDMEVRKDGHGE
ncbi:MAG: PH domain-containing protein [Lachnospiraceae bacterium]|jgi:membrane protein YdbS with pleckstrin-like domain|nr:PH domain-containing protein [Lachnospiraceae bacterium]MEE3461431.1 PH domain-containing protein [Lachnospiraceae bacterium]